VRRAAPRLALIAGLALLLWLWQERPSAGGVWDVLGVIASVTLAVTVSRCLSPAWVHYVRSGERPPGWLASEPVGEWDVVLDAPGRRPVEIMHIVRQATGGPVTPVEDAVEGAPSTVARGVSAGSADRLVAALIAAGASARKQSGR
jgi:ribosomal protein L7/L12